MYKFVKGLAHFFMSLLFRIKIEGDIDISNDKGCLICSNHMSNFDPALIAISVNKELTFMAKQSLFKVPVLSFIMKKCGAISVERNGKDIGALKKAIELLKNNKNLFIFPEGTRNKSGELGDFKKGAAFMAIKANVPIVPIRIVGNYKLFSRMIVRIGEPIFLNVYKDVSADELTEIIKDKIENL